MMSKAASKGFRMWMPNMPMTLVGATNPTANKNATATFRVLPKMTKHEIKEYLTKIYNLPVKKVNTMNYDGKKKTRYTKAGIIEGRSKSYKKAIIQLAEGQVIDFYENI